MDDRCNGCESIKLLQEDNEYLERLKGVKKIRWKTDPPYSEEYLSRVTVGKNVQYNIVDRLFVEISLENKNPGFTAEYIPLVNILDMTE